MVTRLLRRLRCALAEARCWREARALRLRAERERRVEDMPDVRDAVASIRWAVRRSDEVRKWN